MQRKGDDFDPRRTCLADEFDADRTPVEPLTHQTCDLCGGPAFDSGGEFDIDPRRPPVCSFSGQFRAYLWCARTQLKGSPKPGVYLFDPGRAEERDAAAQR